MEETRMMFLTLIDVFHSKGEKSYRYQIDADSVVAASRKAKTKLLREATFQELVDVWGIKEDTVEQKTEEEIAREKLEREEKSRVTVQDSLF